MLLKAIKDKRLDFVLSDDEGAPLVSGQYHLYFQSDRFMELKAKWLAFDPLNATPEELLEQRQRAREMICLRLAVWDLEYEPGKVIPLTAEDITAYGVPDDLLNAIIEQVDSERVPNEKNAS